MSETRDEGFVLHSDAKDIANIWEFIAEDSSLAARRVGEDILDAIHLVPFPHQGHRRLDVTSRPLRFITARNYLIVYAPDESPLLVIAAIHGRRSPRVIAAMLRDREPE